MRRLTPILLGAGALALAACEAPDTLHPSFGNSVRHNMAQHIIDPTPHAPGAPAPAMNGVRAGNAMERYGADSVETLERVRTTDR